MKFEYPEDIHNELTNADVTGKVWKVNPFAFNDVYDNDYKERIKVLDLSFSIEWAIDEIISIRFSQDEILNKIYFEDMILSKIDFSNKESILKSILLEENQRDSSKFNFKNIGENIIKIDFFGINYNKLIEEIKNVREVRNICAHHKKPIFSRENILKPSRTKLYESTEIDKEEFMIRGHFVLWILSAFSKNNHLNFDALKRYYLKYESILKDLVNIS